MQAMMDEDFSVRTLIDRQADELGASTFLVSPVPGARPVTFINLREKSLAITHLLLNRGLVKDDRVALLIPNGVPAAEVLLGVMYAAMIAVPLSPVETKVDLLEKLSHCDAKILISEYRFFGQFSESELGDFGLACISIEEVFDQGGSDRHQANMELPALKGGDAAMLVYTSGSTGHPKGILVSHKNILYGAKNTTDAHSLTSKDRSMCALPLYHMNAQVVTLLSSLLSGGSVVIPEQFTVDSFWNLMEAHSCTWVALSPTLISHLLEPAKATSEYPGAKSENIRFVRSSSAPLAEVQHRTFEERFRLPVIEAMGMTEAGGAIFSNPLPPERRKIGSVGVPWGFEVRLVDTKSSFVSEETVGEVAVRGPSVMIGYFRDPVTTREVLDPQGWLRTGDWARKDEDGYYFIEGRSKEMINRGGEKIAPAEIDAALLEHPGVALAVAFAIPHPTLNEEVGAAVVPRAAARITGVELRQFLFERLSSFKVPRRIWVEHELPLGPTGKPRRREIQAKFAAILAEMAEATTAVPMSPMQRSLAALWVKVLNRPIVKPWDDFFLLGGDSLSAVDLIVAIESELKIDLPLEELVRHSTLHEMANWLMSERRYLPRDLVGINTSGTERPLFGVGGRFGHALPLLLVGRQLGSNQPFYGLQPPEMDWGTAGCSTIPEMAAYYISRVKYVQPTGPYRLIGTSFGGLVVFEMTRQLQASGERVDFLGLLDTDPPGHQIGTRSALPRKTPAAPPLHQAANDIEMAGIRIANAHVDARRQYRVNAPIENEIIYFYCLSEAVALRKDPRRWWRLYTTDIVRWVPVPGQHGFPHQEPQFSALSGLLRLSLSGQLSAFESTTEVFGQRYRLAGHPQAEALSTRSSQVYPIRPHPYGLIESVQTGNGYVRFDGWAADAIGSQPAGKIVAFQGQHCLGYGACGILQTKDRRRSSDSKRPSFSNFRLIFPLSNATGANNSFRLFVLLADGTAGELKRAAKRPLHSGAISPEGKYLPA